MRSTLGALLAAALALPSATVSTALRDRPPTVFTALSWRSIGPAKGGRSIAVAGSTARPLEYYFGATGGGLWKTSDGGTSWRPVTDGQVHSSSVGAIAVAPSRPDVVYIGMGESDLRGSVMQGDGVYRSDDAGRTWRHLGLAETVTVSRIRVHPANPDLVYVAALGDPAGPSPARGVFRSRDGGVSWDKVLFRDERSGAVDLAIDPRVPSTLYATLWEVRRQPWQLWSGGPGSGLFKSIDGGDTWTELTHAPGMPAGPIGKVGIAISGADSARLYAVIEAKAGGLYRSDDAGASWALANSNRDLWQRSFYFNRVAADPRDRDLVYVLNFMIARSADAGATYRLVEGPHVDYHDMWIDPANPDRLIAANDGGATITVNGGATWSSQQYPTAQLYRVETTADFPYHVVACQQDAMSVAVPSVKEDDPGFSYEVGGGESGWVAPHPAKPDVFFAGSTNALTRFDRRTRQARDVQPWPRTVMGEPASAMPERWNWTYPVVFSPIAPHDLYVASQHVWRSRDEGVTWRKISPDLTRAEPATLGDTGGPILFDEDGPEVYGTVFTLAPSRLERQTVWAGSDDGLVHVTRDGGLSWKQVTPPDLPPHTRISVIEASPHAPGRAFIAAKRNQMGDRRPYLYRTETYGAAWTRIDGGLPREDFTHVVREDPVRRGLLYAGTEHGVYVSFDDGAVWQSLSLNLPDVQVPDLKVERHDLVIATHGRSFYVLDNIAPLRQWASTISSAPVHLFAPEGVYRVSQPARIDVMARDTVRGAAIDILDSGGTAIRRIDVPANLAPGHHRLTWDLRTRGAAVFPGMVLEAPNPAVGVIVPPGEYQVRLTAEGVSTTRRFSVRADPRLAQVTPVEYAAQYALSLRLRDATGAANEAVLRIRAAKAGPAATDPARLAELSAIEAELYQVRNQSPKDKIAYPIRLNDRLAGLLAIVQSGDGPPLKAQQVVADQLIAELSRHLERLGRVLSPTASAQRPVGSVRVSPFTMGPAAGGLAAEEGWLSVPENRAKPGSRTIEVHFIRIRGTRPASASPIFYLPGGPGSFVTRANLETPRNLREIAFLRESGRDVLFVNQRGNPSVPGAAKMVATFPPLPLDRAATPASEAAWVRRAVQEGQQEWSRQGVDLAGYDIINIADDVEDLRKALGYPRIILRGGSFGSQWSFAILKRHPASIDRALLRGIEPLDYGYDSPRFLWNAVGRLAAMADGDARLRVAGQSGGLVEAVKTALDRLERQPQTVTIADPATGKPVSVTVGRYDLIQLLKSPASRTLRENLAVWPRFILEIPGGDYRYLAARTFESRTAPDPLPLITVLIDNSLGISGDREARLKAETEQQWIGPLEPLYYATRDVTATERISDAVRADWPIAPPVVLLQGDVDFSTPLENAQHQRRFLERGHLVTVHGGTHAVDDEVLQMLPELKTGLQRFLAARSDAEIAAAMKSLPAEAALPPIVFEAVAGPSLYDEWLRRAK